MPLQPDPVFTKTAQGRAELEARSGALNGRLRAALIVVNGQLPLAALQRVIGDGAAALIEQLRQLGHVEAVDALADPTVAAVPETSAADEHALLAQQIGRRQREALARLAPHFGPDVDMVAQPLLAAREADAFNQALDLMERKLALYLGRREAARTLAGLRI
ncbi:MAG: hypothetical protein ABIF28_16825 [Pseudomonadota bacterium]